MSMVAVVCISSSLAVSISSIPNKTEPTHIRKERGAGLLQSQVIPENKRDDILDPDFDMDFLSSLERHGRNDDSVDFRPLCESVTKLIHLNDGVHEYQPSRYLEVHCKTYSIKTQGNEVIISSNQKCVYPGFSCMPRSETKYFLRRKYEEECWQPFTKEVPSGCDCMWPVNNFGDISRHY